ncbi:MAG: peptidoglycan-associated lipoprotein Pal [Gammaproteobacteria bacterium]|nr:MAG: peptidoglycan-associated lipoprotein Pal [Gammaproteobacteria bacterium]
MRYISMINKLYLLAFLALFVSACATTQGEEVTVVEESVDISAEGEGDGSATPIEESTDGGAMAMPIAEDDLSAEEMLEQSDTALANRTIYFEFDSANLTDESLNFLEVHGNFIADNGNVHVRLEGHADERGSREYNIGLGDRRAQSVRRVLLVQGASSDQIETVSYGEEQPAVMGHTEDAWAKNRRVELIYTVN